MEKTRVLIVDDSAVVRQVLTGVFEMDAGVEALGTVPATTFSMEQSEE